MLRQLDRGAGAGRERDLVDLSGSFDREAGHEKAVVDCRDVLLHRGTASAS